MANPTAGRNNLVVTEVYVIESHRERGGETNEVEVFRFEADYATFYM